MEYKLQKKSTNPPHLHIIPQLKEFLLIPLSVWLLKIHITVLLILTVDGVIRAKTVFLEPSEVLLKMLHVRQDMPSEITLLLLLNLKQHSNGINSNREDLED